MGDKLVLPKGAKEAQKLFPDDETYYADTKYLTNSLLGVLDESPTKFKLKIEGRLPPEKNDAFDIGHRVHEVFLEDKDRGVLLPKGFRKVGQQWTDMQEEHGPKALYLSETNYKMTTNMISSLNESVPDWLTQTFNPEKYRAEVPIIGEVEGVKFKGKADALVYNPIEKENMLIDLKTTKDPLHTFERNFKWGNYPRQAALYSHLAGVDSFYFVVVSKQFPYDVGIYKLSEETRSLGWSKLIKSINKYKDIFVNGTTKEYGRNLVKFGTL
jgi:hypothetical protein